MRPREYTFQFPSSRLAALACYAVAGAYGSRERSLSLTRTLGAYAPTRERSLSLARTFGLTASREEHLTVLQIPIYRAIKKIRV